MDQTVKNEYKIMMSLAVAVAGGILNIGLALLNSQLNSPLFFDSIMTIIVTSRFGLAPGLITALLTNIGLEIAGKTHFVFVLCNFATAVIVWNFTNKNSMRNLSAYMLLGLHITLANTLLGNILAYFTFAGDVGSHDIDNVVQVFLVLGQTLFSSVFLAGFITNLLDKTIAVLIVYGISQYRRH